MFYKSIIFLILSIIAVIAPYRAYIEHEPYSVDKSIYIEDGTSINDAISEIINQNFINKIFLRYFLISHNIETLKSGEYEIYKKTMSQIIFDMYEGNTITHKLIINEGINIYDLNKLINESNLINDCQYLNCIKTDFNFKEGILYPDTYFYKKNNFASDILQKSHDRLKNYLDDLNFSSNNNDLDIEELLILASIVEKEAGNNDEKKLIAGVFLRRLEERMRLQADPTIIYGLLPNFDGDIKKSNILDRNNKYNTYMIKGLPPSPIAISSLSSIDAVFKGKPGEFLYFVADSKTTHHFSKTYQEHLNKIEELGLNKWRLLALKELKVLVNQHK